MDMFCKQTIYLLVLIYLLQASDVICFFYGEKEGERCTTAFGVEGVCKVVIACRSVVRSIHRRVPTLCSWKYSLPVVCCPTGRQDDLFYFHIAEEYPSLPILRLEDYDKFIRDQKCGFRNPTRYKRDTQVTTNEVPEELQQYSKKIFNIEPILSGTSAEPGDWPWMAAVFKKQDRIERFFCGGSIISRKCVLTAAHCFVGKGRKIDASHEFVVRVGSHVLAEGTSYRVSEVQVHEDYAYPRNYHDIALLLLDEPIEYDSTTGPVCLPFEKYRNESEVVGEFAIVTGFGDQAFGGVNSRYLMEVDVPVVSNTMCNATYARLKGSAFPMGITEKLLCAGHPEGGKDACQGDSGGPLVVHDGENRFTQVGIVSSGRGCGLAGYPGIYTRVSEYMDWIEQHCKGY